MRYVILSKGIPLDKLERELVRLGASNVKRAHNVDQLFCDVDEAAVARIKQIPGIKASESRIMRPAVIPPAIEIRPAALPSAQQAQDMVTESFEYIRSYYVPPLTGAGLTVAVLDTGIRKTHVSLLGKVVYEYDATDSESVSDIWGHGTGTAYLICGGELGGQHVGVSPGAKVMNIKVLNDDGVGTDETIIDGINHVIELAKQARFNGLAPTADMFPNIINISIGGEDMGDEDDPIRVACRRAIEDWGVDVIAAAGNTGPEHSTIMIPAAEPLVVAVGGTELGTINIWERSSRGPTLQGDTKPDFMAWATDITVATHKNDTGYDVKSGTSFSCPIISGLTGLIWETVRAQVDPFTAQMYVWRWSEAKAYAPYFCVKPSDAALVKDNNYGFGSPAGGVMVEQIAGPTDVETMMESMPMIMVFGLLAGMVG